MPYLNKVTLMGHLTADPELRHTQRGTPYVNFTIAQNFRAGDGGEERAEFYDCVAWKGWAENFVKGAKKGALVLVDGRLRQESWTDRDSGQKRSRLRVNAQLTMVIPKSEGAGGAQERVVFEHIEEDVPF